MISPKDTTSFDIRILRCSNDYKISLECGWENRGSRLKAGAAQNWRPHTGLPLFGGGLLVQELCEVLSGALSFALGNDVQEADLELDLGEVVHDPLYRTYEWTSIGVRYSFI